MDWEDDLDIKIEDDLKNEDNLKKWPSPPKFVCPHPPLPLEIIWIFFMTSQRNIHTTIRVKPEMIPSV